MADLAELSEPHVLVTRLARHGDPDRDLDHATADQLRQALEVAVDRIRILTGRQPHHPQPPATNDRTAALEHLADTARTLVHAGTPRAQLAATPRLAAAVTRLDATQEPT